MQASEQYRDQTSSFGNQPSPLDPDTGRFILVGFGLFFTAYSFFSVKLYLKYNNVELTSELFSSAGRQVGTGAIACAIVSSWTWSATILQSCNVTYDFGVSGALWYASGATIQLFLIGILSFHLKKKCANAHTIGEIIYARWGTACHIVFLYFFLLTNILVLAMLIGGGASVFQVMTGLDRGSASFLIRVFFYSGSGGVLSQYMSAYLHVSLSFLLMLGFMFEVYMFSDTLGSPDAIYDRLTAVASQSDETCIEFGYDVSTQTCGGVQGNLDGSYLTVQSLNGLFFGVINIVGNFGAVFCDQSYWMVAISARPDACFKGFILGGFLWFAVPFCMATALGLANVALQLPTTTDEADKGLVAVASMWHLAGGKGVLLLMIQLFMAVSAAGSAELNSISSLVVYDIYRTYMNPKADGRDIKYYSRLCVMSVGSMLGALSLFVQELGLSLGWMYLCMGIMIGSAVFPICCCLTWEKATATAAISAALGGQVLAITAWLSATYIAHGVIDLDTTGKGPMMLIGNLVALLSSVLIMTTITLFNPDSFDFSTFNEKFSLVPTAGDKASDKEEEEEMPLVDVSDTTTVQRSSYMPEKLSSFANHVEAYSISIALSVLLVIVWPALAAPAGVFSKSYFRFWVSIAMIWALSAACIVIILPVYETREGIRNVAKGIYNDYVLGVAPNWPPREHVNCSGQTENPILTPVNGNQHKETEMTNRPELSEE